MKNLFFTGLLLAIITCKSNIQANTSLGNAFNVYANRDTATIAGKWHLMPVLPSDTAAGTIPQLIFDVATKKFSGNTGCNVIRGGFEIKEDALLFGANMILTKMACPGYNEKAYLNNLFKTNRYKIENGVLQLMYNTTILSRWARQSDTLTTKQI